MVPENKTGSWGMNAIRVRRSRSLTVEISIPSMKMEPLLGSISRRSVNVRDDLKR